MGNYQSTRWNSHRKKNTVEDALTLRLKVIYSSLLPGHSGIVFWKFGEDGTASIAYSIVGVDDIPILVQLDYQSNGQSVRYPVFLTSTALPWGGRRYWFCCPNQFCRRRVTTLHKVGESQYFECRNCNNLTYTSSQESGSDRYLKEFGTRVLGYYPYITGKDITALMEGRFTKNLKRMVLEKAASKVVNWENSDSVPDLDSEYLHRDELCRQSNLSQENLKRLNEYRLLVPDHHDMYRPKLISWAKKLAYLLDHGWELAEIKLWAKGRFQRANPRRWPPKRSDWKI